jgi:hypothetical protein
VTYIVDEGHAYTLELPDIMIDVDRLMKYEDRTYADREFVTALSFDLPMLVIAGGDILGFLPLGPHIEGMALEEAEKKLGKHRQHQMFCTGQFPFCEVKAHRQGLRWNRVLRMYLLPMKLRDGEGITAIFGSQPGSLAIGTNLGAVWILNVGRFSFACPIEPTLAGSLPGPITTFGRSDINLFTDSDILSGDTGPRYNFNRGLSSTPGGTRTVFYIGMSDVYGNIGRITLTERFYSDRDPGQVVTADGLCTVRFHRMDSPVTLDPALNRRISNISVGYGGELNFSVGMARFSIRDSKARVAMRGSVPNCIAGCLDGVCHCSSVDHEL